MLFTIFSNVDLAILPGVSKYMFTIPSLTFLWMFTYVIQQQLSHLSQVFGVGYMMFTYVM